MAVANDIIGLALRMCGALGVGQLPQAQDNQDAFVLLNDTILNWTQERLNLVIPGALPVFADFTTDVPFWTPYQNALVWNLSVRLRVQYGLEPNEVEATLAQTSGAFLQSNNKQQFAAPHPGVPATPIQVIFLALRMAGRITDKQGVADTSQDVSDAFALLVSMLAEWDKERWLVFNEVDVFFTSTGALSYTIGAGAQFNLASRTDRIMSAFVRMPPGPVADVGFFDPNGFTPFFAGGDQTVVSSLSVSPQAVDYPLEILSSREDYNQITLKGMTSFPRCVWLDSGYPFGHVYVWPLPAAGQFEIHLSAKATLPSYVGLSDSLGLPPEYNQAMITNLACEIMLFDGKQPTDFLLGRARSSLQTLRKANLQIGRLGMPYGLPNGRRGAYGFGGIGGVIYPNTFDQAQWAP